MRHDIVTAVLTHEYTKMSFCCRCRPMLYGHPSLLVTDDFFWLITYPNNWGSMHLCYFVVYVWYLCDHLSVSNANVQELISYRYSLVLVLVGAISSRQSRFKSDRDEIWREWSSSKYASMTESDFRFDVIVSRWRPWRHFTQKSAAAWRVNTKPPSARAYAAAYASSWSTVHLYLFDK